MEETRPLFAQEERHRSRQGRRCGIKLADGNTLLRPCSEVADLLWDFAHYIHYVTEIKSVQIPEHAADFKGNLTNYIMSQWCARICQYPFENKTCIAVMAPLQTDAMTLV